MSAGYSLHIGLNSVDPNHYQGWSGPLVACEADARDMRDIAGTMGFATDVVLTRSATRSTILGKLETAAKTCQPGDFMLVTYSGHGGQVPDLNYDEPDGADETWCLFDAQLIDDEIYRALNEFKPGVRVLVLSDSCHSGTVTKNAMVMETVSAPADSGMTYRAMPNELALAIYQAHKTFYDQILTAPKLGESWRSISASALLISGCQDNQLSMDGPFNGAFTAALKRSWNGGMFRGDYIDFHQAVQRQLPASQSPNLFWANGVDTHFLAQRPFTINPVRDAPVYVGNGAAKGANGTGDCLLTVQIRGLDIASDADVAKFCQSIVPGMVQEIRSARSSKGQKGCSVSGSVSTGAGGTSGSGTITCTF